MSGALPKGVACKEQPVNRKTVRWLDSAGVALLLLGAPLLFIGADRLSTLSPASMSSGWWFWGISMGLLVLGDLLIVLAAMGALITLQRERQYGWSWAIIVSFLLTFLGMGVGVALLAVLGVLLLAVLLLIFSVQVPSTASPPAGSAG